MSMFRTPSHLAAVVTLALTLALAAAPAVQADTVLKMTSHTDAAQAMGESQPAQDVDFTVWIGDDRAVRSSGDTSVLLRLDQKKLYVIDHGAKQYSVLELPVDLAANLPPDMKQQMAPMLEAMSMTATVEPTEERKTINGWEARLYRVDLSNQLGITADSEVWVTHDVEVDLESLREITRATMALQPGFGSVADELVKIEGLPVLVETDLQGRGGGMTRREELVSAETQDAPAGTYEVPEGYTEEPWNPMAQGG